MTDATNLYLDLLEKVVISEINPENGIRMQYLVDTLTGPQVPRFSKAQLIANLVNLHKSNDLARAMRDNIYLEPRHVLAKTLGFPFSMVGPERIRNVRNAAETVIGEEIPGAMVETGVWRGGSCIMMKGVMTALNDTRPLYVCDSFEGLPDVPDGPDKDLTLHSNPLLAAPLEDVQSHFERLGLLDDDVHFVKGWFSDTMAGVADAITDGISVLRLDGDYYTSTMDVLRPLYPLVNKGGFVIVDDYYGFPQCEQAIDEYREEFGITAQTHQIDEMALYWRVE